MYLYISIRPSLVNVTTHICYIILIVLSLYPCKCHDITVKPAYNGTERDRIFFSVAGRFSLIYVFEVKEPRGCDSFPLKTRFRFRVSV